MAAQTILEMLEESVQQAREMDAPLNERLAVVANRVRALNSGLAEAVDRMIQRLQDAGAGAAAPQVGELMPPFTLPDETGHLVSLTKLLETGPLAVSFNRGHWCPYCRLNVFAMAEAREAVEATGARIVAIMPERRRFTNLLKAEVAAPYPILTDMDNGYALSLNLAIWVGEEVSTFIAGAGWNVPLYQGNDAWMLPIPATFIVGADGIIVARYLDPDYRKRMEIEDLIMALKETR